MSPVSSQPLQPIQTFLRKVEEIKSTPHKLRRTIAAWPWYSTLEKPLTQISAEELEKLRAEEPVLLISARNE
jgi:hypothetical protein